MDSDAEKGCGCLLVIIIVVALLIAGKSDKDESKPVDPPKAKATTVRRITIPIPRNGHVYEDEIDEIELDGRRYFVGYDGLRIRFIQEIRTGPLEKP